LCPRYELGWAAHKELDKRAATVILATDGLLDPASRLVPTTDPKVLNISVDKS
jgi:hypothetical protein